MLVQAGTYMAGRYLRKKEEESFFAFLLCGNVACRRGTKDFAIILCANFVFNMRLCMFSTAHKIESNIPILQGSDKATQFYWRTFS